MKGLIMLAKHILTVKRQLDHYRSELERFTPSHPRYRPDKVALYQRIADDLSGVLEYLLERQRRLEARTVPPNNDPPPIIDMPPTLTPAPTRVKAPIPEALGQRDDLSDLPPELLAQLSDSARGETDPLVQIIEERGGTASLDEILIDLWRKHREVAKRALIANKLYRLSKRELCWPVAGKKGVYTTTPTATRQSMDEADDDSKDEGPDGGTPEPSSNRLGVAGSQEGPSKPSPVGSSPSTSTKTRRDLLAGAAIPSVRVPR
jgi:hypothetical protein